jgi:signal transduction histidine kinase
MKKIFKYLNPITHLGEGRYSILFPLLTNLAVPVLSEIYAYRISGNPDSVGVYIIFINVAFIIYFAFREGIRGGLIAAVIAVLYYFYIIYTRHYTGQQFNSGIITTIILAVIYLILAFVIGWLKQTIDKLIEREANEKIRLKTILQQLPVGVVITDNNGKVEHANKQLENILGIKVPVGFAIGVDKELVSGAYNNRPANHTQSPLLQALKTGKSVSGREFAIKRKNGKQAFIQVNSSKISNYKGKTIAAASIINDITQQKEMEKRKDDFVNMASHELKTPLTSMKLYINSLLNRIKKNNDDKSQKILSSIKLQTDRLQALVNDLLDVSRLQTGKLSFNTENFNINSLIKETIEHIQETAKDRKIIYTNQPPIRVTADKFRIYQVLTNLLTNAVKYSQEGKKIEVSVRRTAGNIIVSVRDYGIGIAKDEQAKIFNRLYQVIGDTEKTFPGLGMGLFISKEIIRRHKGKIWVESEKGKGSTFYFSLPIRKAGIKN